MRQQRGLRPSVGKADEINEVMYYGTLFPDDSSYNEAVRMTGFDRYRQLLSFYWGSYLKAGLLLTVGALPLALGIAAGIMTSSILVLIPASLVGGMIMGPFLAMMCNSSRHLRGWENSCRYMLNRTARSEEEQLEKTL